MLTKIKYFPVTTANVAAYLATNTLRFFILKINTGLRTSWREEGCAGNSSVPRAAYSQAWQPASVLWFALPSDSNLHSARSLTLALSISQGIWLLVTWLKPQHRCACMYRNKFHSQFNQNKGSDPADTELGTQKRHLHTWVKLDQLCRCLQE